MLEPICHSYIFYEVTIQECLLPIFIWGFCLVPYRVVEVVTLLPIQLFLSEVFIVTLLPGTCTANVFFHSVACLFLVMSSVEGELSFS